MDERPDSQPVNGWFRLTAAMTALFVLTILMMVAAALSGGQPAIVRFFNDHGMLLLGVEVAAILLTGFLAMAADRREAQTSSETRNAIVTADSHHDAQSNLP